MRTLLIVAATLAVGPPVRADEHYLTIFTAESTPFRPEKAHTFVAVTRIPAGGDPVETHSISWLAATTVVRGVALRPEEGRNFTLAETFAIIHRDCLRVSVWGPYRIRPELFCLLRDQSQRLDSGAVKYKGTDTLVPSRVAMNCYHAIWNVSHPLRKYAGPFTCGDTTGGKTVHLFREWIVCPERTHDEILSVLGVDQEPLVRRPHDYWPGRFAAMRATFGR
jgi:hypothetical protein